MTFSDQLRALRTRKQLSQSQAAALIPGLSVRTLQEWETDRRTPPTWAQFLILTYLKTIRKRRK